jgi:hypothetical protein
LKVIGTLVLDLVDQGPGKIIAYLREKVRRLDGGDLLIVFGLCQGRDRGGLTDPEILDLVEYLKSL